MRKDVANGDRAFVVRRKLRPIARDRSVVVDQAALGEHVHADGSDRLGA